MANNFVSQILIMEYKMYFLHVLFLLYFVSVLCVCVYIAVSLVGVNPPKI